MLRHYKKTLLVTITVLMWTGCGDEGSIIGSLDPPNIKDPDSFWLGQYPVWVRFDGKCRGIYRIAPTPAVEIREVNPSTGEIWGVEYYRGVNILYIFEPDGKNGRRVASYDYYGGYEFDTNSEVVWIINSGGTIAKLNYRGRIIMERPCPEDLAGIKVFEKTGEVWAFNYPSSTHSRLYKFDPSGSLLFSKSPADIGFPSREVEFSSIFIDQTDGGVWVRLGGLGRSNNLYKLDSAGVRTAVPSLHGEILATDYRTGNVLIRDSDFFYAYLFLYDKEGNLLWMVHNKYTFEDSVFTGTGEVIVLERTSRNAPYSLGRIDNGGRWIARYITVPKPGPLKKRRHAYPYNDTQ